MATLKNARHELFCQYVAQGKTSVASFELAGYKPDDRHASRLRHKPEVEARIAELIGKAAAKCEVTVERIISELALIGFSNFQDYMRITSDGDPQLNLSDLTREQAAALSEVSIEDYLDGRGDDARDVKRIKFKLYDKVSALEKLGKHLGMFKERVEHSGAIDLTGSRDALNGKLASLASRIGAASVPSKPN